MMKLDLHPQQFSCRWIFVSLYQQGTLEDSCKHEGGRVGSSLWASWAFCLLVVVNVIPTMLLHSGSTASFPSRSSFQSQCSQHLQNHFHRAPPVRHWHPVFRDLDLRPKLKPAAASFLRCLTPLHEVPLNFNSCLLYFILSSLRI